LIFGVGISFEGELFRGSDGALFLGFCRDFDKFFLDRSGYTEIHGDALKSLGFPLATNLLATEIGKVMESAIVVFGSNDEHCPFCFFANHTNLCYVLFLTGLGFYPTISN
jgi:hypothetical protein